MLCLTVYFIFRQCTGLHPRSFSFSPTTQPFYHCANSCITVLHPKPDSTQSHSRALYLSDRYMWGHTIHCYHLNCITLFTITLSRLLWQQFLQELPRHQLHRLNRGFVASVTRFRKRRQLHKYVHKSLFPHPFQFIIHWPIWRYGTWATDNSVTDATKTNRQRTE